MSTYSRRDWLSTTLGAASAAALTPRASAKKTKSPELNVLFIAVDDLRPALGCYGLANARTPNIDALAADGVLFSRAHCQQAVCSPSRTSLMTGLRPDATRVYDLETHFRRYRPDAVTLPQHFKQHGYISAAFSKIYHKPAMDDYPSWSMPSWIPDFHEWNSAESQAYVTRNWRALREAGWRSNERFYYEPSKRKPKVEGQRGWGMPSWESRAVPDHALPDGMTADAVIKAINLLKSRRFFVAAGFLKPHLPFVAPEKYYDLHPASEIDLAPFTDAPADAPPYALHNSGEMRGYTDIPREGPIDEKKARELIRGYRASVSYVDAQIGRVITALDRNGLRENTVIVLWGDHGYHLGDHGLWNKHTNFEAATRSPLIVSAPGRLNKARRPMASPSSSTSIRRCASCAAFPAPRVSRDRASCRSSTTRTGCGNAPSSANTLARSPASAPAWGNRCAPAATATPSGAPTMRRSNPPSCTTTKPTPTRRPTSPIVPKTSAW